MPVQLFRVLSHQHLHGTKPATLILAACKMNNSLNFSICLVGAGNMGGAMFSGWLESGIAPQRITVIDPNPPEKINALISNSGAVLAREPIVGLNPDVLIIAVKPQLMEKVLPDLKTLIGDNTVAVSVAAGTAIAMLTKHLGNCAVVRAMPNTPALICRGITVCCANANVSSAQRDRVDELLSAVGKVEWVDDEKQIDTVTAVSGSGPAYVFYLAECMAAAGIELGLSPELAEKLANETIAGAGEMLSQLEQPAFKLRENVTSPNGTTAAALSVLMAERGLKDLMMRAITRAKQRSQELS